MPTRSADVNEGVNDGVDDGVEGINEGVNEGVNDGVNEDVNDGVNAFLSVRKIILKPSLHLIHFVGQTYLKIL